jgi:multidrug efflux pump subunit AcrB
MLFIFLRRITPTFIVAAAIPVSLIFAVIILFWPGTPSTSSPSPG